MSERFKTRRATPMETILVKIFATALALSQVTTTPDAVKTQFDRVRDQEQAHSCCTRADANAQSFDIEASP